jgi:hypothetical protein
METNMQENNQSQAAREPEALLKSVNKSIFIKALVISAVVHFVFAGVTSFSLYKSWAKHGMFKEGYGLLSPSDIREIEEDEKKAALDAEQEAKMAARLDEQRKQAKLEMEKKEEGQSTPEPPATEESEPQVPEIEPLPPKEFSLDDLPEL